MTHGRNSMKNKTPKLIDKILKGDTKQVSTTVQPSVADKGKKKIANKTVKRPKNETLIQQSTEKRKSGRRSRRIGKQPRNQTIARKSAKRRKPDRRSRPKI